MHTTVYYQSNREYQSSNNIIIIMYVCCVLYAQYAYYRRTPRVLCIAITTPRVCTLVCILASSTMHIIYGLVCMYVCILLLQQEYAYEHVHACVCMSTIMHNINTKYISCILASTLVCIVLHTRVQYARMHIMYNTTYPYCMHNR